MKEGKWNRIEGGINRYDEYRDVKKRQILLYS